MMSLDQRLREALDRVSTGAAPDVERSLHTVLGRRRRRVVVRRLAVAVAAAGLAVVLPFTAGSLIDGAPPVGIPPAAERVAGDYEVTLSDADSAGLDPSLSGVWRMRLEAHGLLVLTAPPAFEGEQNTTGVSFTADETTFRTNAFYSDFCSTLGSYTWQLAGTQLVLQVTDDPCEMRRVLFATRPWTRTG